MVVILLVVSKNYEVAVDNLNDLISFKNNQILSIGIELSDAQREIKELKKEVENLKSKKEITDVVFTNYYPNDADGSTYRTGSGLTTAQFMINDKGWYTYNDMVVLATSTYECLLSNSKGCSAYSKLSDAKHKLYRYGDIITFEVDDHIYKGIILDSCGQSFKNDVQLFDIYMPSKKYAFGKKKGKIYESEE